MLTQFFVFSHLSKFFKGSKFSIFPILPWFRSSSSVFSLTTMISCVSSSFGGGVTGGGGDPACLSTSLISWFAVSFGTTSCSLLALGASVLSLTANLHWLHYSKLRNKGCFQLFHCLTYRPLRREKRVEAPKLFCVFNDLRRVKFVKKINLN